MKLLLPLLLPLASAKSFNLRKKGGARALYNYEEDEYGYVNNIATGVQFSSCITLKTNNPVATQLNQEIYQQIQSGNYRVRDMSQMQAEGEEGQQRYNNQYQYQGQHEYSKLDAVYSVENYVVFNRAIKGNTGSDLHMTTLDNFVASLGELGDDLETKAEEICEICGSWGQLSYNYCSLGYKDEDEWATRTHGRAPDAAG